MGDAGAADDRRANAGLVVADGTGVAEGGAVDVSVLAKGAVGVG